MLSSALRHLFNRLTPYIARTYRLGHELDKRVGCVRGTYDFSVQGGVTATAYTLKDKDGADLKLPLNAVITDVFVHVLTAVTSAGSATISLQANAANDLMNATAKASFTLNACVQGIPDQGTAADNVVLTAERTLKLVPNTADLTAGKLNVFISYVLTGTD